MRLASAHGARLDAPRVSDWLLDLYDALRYLDAADRARLEALLSAGAGLTRAEIAEARELREKALDLRARAAD
ncbi:MAG: hypothetical protein ACFE0R_13910 [Salinarimonas sp.]